MRLALTAPALLLAACTAPTEELRLPRLALEAPATVDLGWITTDEPAAARFVVTNVGEATVELTGLAPLAPIPEFRAEITPSRLHPGDAADVTAHLLLRAPAPDTLALPVAIHIDGLDPDDPRAPVVEIVARVSHSGLVAEPNPLTIGPVLYLDTQTGTVGLTNLRSTPVDVFALRHADGRAQYEEAVTRGDFGPLPAVDVTGRITTLAPYETRVLDIAYTAPDGPGEAKEQATWRVASCLGDDSCALDLVVQGVPDHDAPAVHLSPSDVHFGPISVGATVERELRITNAGRRPLSIEDIRFTGPANFVATLPPDTEIPPGGETFATFRYTPTHERLDNGELVFTTNDPLNGTVDVRVTGSGVVLPPCRFQVQPSQVDFGAVEVFGTQTRVAVVMNVGEEPCVVFDPQIRPHPGTDPLTFYFERVPPSSVTLQPDTVASYTLTFAPTRPGHHHASLELRTSPTEIIDVMLIGRTPDGQILSCPASRTVDLGEAIVLSAALERGRSAQRFDWRLLSGPEDDGTIAARLTANGDRAELEPELIGTYVVEVEVTTTDGERQTCQTEVTARSTGFRATLTWDGAGDLDLHVHRGATAP